MIKYSTGLALCLSIALPRFAFAQLEDIQTKQPNVQNGQLFVVRVEPAGKKFRVFVVGKNVAEVKFNKLNISASMKVGTRIWNLEPDRQNDYFSLKAPSDLPTGAQPQLKLKVDYGERSENFDFKLDPKK